MKNPPNSSLYPLYEYLLLIEPGNDVQQKIKAETEQFSEAVKAALPALANPSMALVTFSQFSVAEDRIIRHLHSVASGIEKTLIELDGFDGLPSHTIFVRVKCGEALRGIIRNVQTSMQRLMKADDSHKPNFISEPRIVIARKLKPWQYEKAFPEYRERNFISKFTANGMLLLRKKPNETKFESVDRFSFSDKVTLAAQGNLFD